MKQNKEIWENWSCREPGKAHLTACAQRCYALVKVSSILSQKNPLISSKSASCIFTFPGWPALTCFGEPGPAPVRGGVPGNAAAGKWEDL